MYYYYNPNMTGFEAVSPVFRHPCLFDEREIPLENAVLFHGLLYDLRTIDYWKAYKLQELDTYKQSVMSAGHMTSINVKADTDYDALLWQSLGNTLSDLNGNSKTVDFMDYNGELKTLSQSDYKKLCKEVGNKINDLRKSYAALRKRINTATTVAQLQAIVIEGK